MRGRTINFSNDLSFPGLRCVKRSFAAEETTWGWQSGSEYSPTPRARAQYGSCSLSDIDQFCDQKFLILAIYYCSHFTEFNPQGTRQAINWEPRKRSKVTNIIRIVSRFGECAKLCHEYKVPFRFLFELHVIQQSHTIIYSSRMIDGQISWKISTEF